MKVIATNKFKAEGVRPKELNSIPEEGKEFEITEERFKILLGMGYVAEAVSVEDETREEPIEDMEVAVAEETKETAVKKTKKVTKNAKK